MGLKEYAKKRDFTKTPEPGPAEPKQQGKEHGGFFCVQRHDATRLHYDFRLEVNGVLVSWAVPKGPSLDPKRKALAMKVEDHPFGYGTFEGNIPAGEYGGGSVMLWDKGTFDVLGETPASEQIERGDFKFELHGTKLNGSFAIVHMKHAKKGNEWLLIKKQDEFAVPDYDIDQYAWSVATRRTQEQIAGNVEALSAADLKGAKKAALPAQLEPMLATAVTKVPDGAALVLRDQMGWYPRLMPDQRRRSRDLFPPGKSLRKSVSGIILSAGGRECKNGLAGRRDLRARRAGPYSLQFDPAANRSESRGRTALSEDNSGHPVPLRCSLCGRL